MDLPHRSTPVLVGLILWITVLTGAPLGAAEPHALLARGFQADQIYDFNDIDHVNVFNGNLVVTVPIGQRYPLGGGFDYGFMLVYNSHIWDYVADCPIDGRDEYGEGQPVILTDPAAVPEGCLRGIPNPKSNAGTSWRLSLGELYDVFSPLFPGLGWVFVGPDGAEHKFGPTEGASADDFPQYSRDDSDLRLRLTSASATPACTGIVGTCMAVDRPDGAVYAFEATGGPAGWRLRRIQDPFGNWVSVTYSAGDWTVDDSLNRSHTVDFDGAGVLASVTLEAFGGQTATYGFATESSPPILPGCPHDFDVQGESEHELLTQLTAVTLPDGSRYSFSYVADDGFTGNCSRFTGRLETIVLPTGGEIEYGYDGFQFPVSSCDTPLIRFGGKRDFFHTQWGVTLRTSQGIDGTLKSETHYRSGGLSAAPTRQSYTAPDPPREICIVPRTTFTDVYEKADQGRYRLTRHFFTVTQPAGGVTDDWTPLEHQRYGLPVDHITPDPRHAQRYRSSMVFDCPSYPAPSEDYGPNCAVQDIPGCWPADAQHLRIPTSCYEGPRFATPTDVRGLRDRYVEHEAGVFHYCDGSFTTSPGCETSNWQAKSDNTYFYDSLGDYYVETARSDPDGYGHYRTTTTRSNSPRSVEHKTEIAYRPAVTPQTWLLNLFDEMKVTENGQTSRESYVFDRTKGFLETKTTHRTGGNLVATYTPDAAGNVKTETYAGGDSGQASYVVENQFENGILSSSRYIRGGRTILRPLDADIDKTGLPSASRDPAGLETLYSFDTMGRLTSVTPQAPLAEAATGYTYTVADPARTASDERASVTIVRGDTRSQIFFDGLGRPNEEHARLPDGSTNRRFTAYTTQGRVASVTTLHDKSDLQNARKTETRYDVFGRPTRIQGPDHGLTSSGSSVTSIFYAGPFQTVRQIRDVETPEGPQKLRTVYQYDHQGRLVVVREIEEDPNSFDERLNTKYSYDQGGRLVRVNQGGGTQVRRFDYDGAGLLTRECHPELAGGCIEYGGYDARGNASRRRYSLAGGEAFELDFVYDGAERLTQVRSAQDDRLLKEFFYTNLYDGSFSPLDGNGRLYQSKRHNYVDGRDIVATVTNTYAGIGGRLSRRTVATGGNGDVPRVRFTTELAYDFLGNLTRITYPDCDQAGCAGRPPARTVTRSYTRGLLTGVGVPADAERYAQLTYHPNLTLHRVTHGNGVVDEVAQDPSQLQRAGGIEVRTGADPGVGTLWDATYGYDASGNLVSRTSRELTSSGAVLFDATDTFRYDNAFNRLVSAAIHYWEPTGAATESRDYEYDLFGNLTSISGSNPRNLSPSAPTNRLASPFTYDAAGNLTSQPGWDALGNPTAPTDWYYSYDPFNMMTRARKAGGSVVRRFLYTADDERLAVLADGRELWTLRGADAGVIRDVEYLSTGWRWVEDYVHGGGGLLASVADVGGEKHYHLDHLGSPRLVTGPTKQVLARHVHAPYGEELTPTDQNELRMKFTGHERDDLDTTGGAGDLDYMHARYYNSQLGGFLSTDPKRLRKPTPTPQRWNRYAYAHGNPINYLDPDGRDVVYQTKKDQKFFEKQAARSARVRAALDYFAPGTGRDLFVNRGNAGRTSFGVKRAGATELTLTPHSPEAFREAYEAAGGGAAGEEAVLEMGDRFLSEATITLTSDATNFQKLHELGHVEEGILDPDGALESAAEAESATTLDEYRASPGEQYADEFAEDVLDDDEDRREPE